MNGTVEYFLSNDPMYVVWFHNGSGIAEIRGHRGARKQLIKTLRGEGFKGTLIFPHGKRKVTIK